MQSINNPVSNRGNNLGTLRFIAAAAVLFGHSYNLTLGKNGHFDPIGSAIHKITPFGLGLPGMAVATFFIISGYLVSKSLIERGNLLSYFEARVLRIYPALIVAVLFCAFIIGPLATTLSLPDYLSHKGTLNYALHNSSLWNIHFRLPGVFMSNPWQGGVNGSLWTLPIELSMYIFVAVAGYLGLLKKRRVFNACALTLVLAYIASPENFPLLQNPNHHYLGLSFLMGAFCYINREALPLKLSIFILALIASILAKGHSWYDFFCLFTFAYGVLLLGFSKTIRLPDLAAKGDLSYGLYLYAFPLQQLSIYYLGADSPLLITLVSFIGAVLLAKASWTFVEQPSLKLKGRCSSYILSLVRKQA